MATCHLRDHRRLLATPIGVSLLRIDLALDLYARNPFRIIVAPAWLEDDQRDALIQRFRNLYKLRPASAMKNVLRLGYEELAEIHDPIKLLNDLREPQRRLVWELFWPHVGADDFKRISPKGVLTIPKKDVALALLPPSPTVPVDERPRSPSPSPSPSPSTSPTVNIDQNFDSTLHNEHERIAALCNRAGHTEFESQDQADVAMVFHELPKERLTAAALWTHTFAILHHNRALAIELSITNVATEPTRARSYRVGADNHWRKSLDYWATTIANPIFWEYLKHRIEILDDPQLRPLHLEPLRDELPAAILSFNATLVRSYVGAGCMEDAARHLRLIGANPLHFPVQRTIMGGLLREVANAWLNPLVQQLENQRPRQPVPWKKIRDWLIPIIESAEKLPAEMKEKFLVDEISLTDMQFDSLAEKVYDNINPEVVDYQQSSCKTLLFLISIFRRLLCLPMSASLRRKIDERRGEYTENLYGRFYENPHQARQLDPTECWFLAGEAADPEVSILLPVYKITSTKGNTTLWNSQEVLIPRSQLAEAFHLGEVEDILKQRQAEIVKLNQAINEVSREAERDHDRLTTACTTAIAQEDAYRQGRMRMFDEEIAPEENVLKMQVQAVKDIFQPRMTEVETRLVAAQAVATERWAPALTVARQTITRLQPLARFTRINLPVTGVVTIAITLSISTFSAAKVFTLYYLASLELSLRGRFHASDQIVDYLPILVASILTIILASILTEIVLSGKERSARRALEKIEGRQAEALSWVDHIIQDQREVILREQNGQIHDQQSQLDIIEEHRSEFAQEMNQVVENVKNSHQQEIERRQVFDDHLMQLNQRVAAYQTPPKNIDDKINFPAYSEALQIGYFPGERPQKQDVKSDKQRRTAKLWPF